MLRDGLNVELSQARQMLLRARDVLVITGAGMSAECGIPTFRQAGDDGEWDRLAQTFATTQGFAANPQQVWHWYAERRRTALAVEPHAGYRALAGWERLARVHIVTQNVDGLHSRAGSTNVVELHGTLHRFLCVKNRHQVTGVEDSEEVPSCPRCGSYVRPAVVWFGEMIPEQAVEGSARAIQNAEAVLVIGTSLKVTTPAGLLQEAGARGLPIIEINPEPALSSRSASWLSPYLPQATFTLAVAAAEVLPQLLDPGME